MPKSSQIEVFYRLSSLLTGFSVFELRGTGMGEKYFEILHTKTGERPVTVLLQTFSEATEIAGDDLQQAAVLVKQMIIETPHIGPVARNIIKLWYLGSWYPLPQSWSERWEQPAEDQGDAFVVAPQAYVESLVWRVMKTHPMGAKQPGYGTWKNPLTEV